MQEKRNLEGCNPISPDIYENTRKLNTQLATRGPAVLYALGKASEHVTNSQVVTAIGGMVIGAFGFFGNRYFRSKGEDSAYSYMGQIVGGIQFTAGFMLLAVEAFENYSNMDESSSATNIVKMSGISLTLTLSALVLVNSYLYGDGPAKEVADSRPKLD